MDAKELRCRQALLEMRQRAPVGVHGLARMNAHQVIIGLDPVDLVHADEHDAPIRLHRDTVERTPLGVHGLDQRLERSLRAFVRHVGPDESHHAVNRLREALAAHRFQNVVERMNLERSERVLDRTPSRRRPQAFRLARPRE